MYILQRILPLPNLVANPLAMSVVLADASWDPASGSASHLVSSSHNSFRRQLKQSAFCPDGCDGNQNCIQDSTVGGLRCQKCKNNLRVSPIDGRCSECDQCLGGGGCPRGGGCSSLACKGCAGCGQGERQAAQCACGWVG